MSGCAWELRTIADSGTLCRVIGMFAQLGLAPPDLEVRNGGDELAIHIRTGADSTAVTALERRMAAVFGVIEVRRAGPTCRQRSAGEAAGSSPGTRPISPSRAGQV